MFTGRLWCRQLCRFCAVGSFGESWRPSPAGSERPWFFGVFRIGLVWLMARKGMWGKRSNRAELCVHRRVGLSRRARSLARVRPIFATMLVGVLVAWAIAKDIEESRKMRQQKRWRGKLRSPTWHRGSRSRQRRAQSARLRTKETARLGLQSRAHTRLSWAVWLHVRRNDRLRDRRCGQDSPFQMVRWAEPRWHLNFAGRPHSSGLVRTGPRSRFIPRDPTWSRHLWATVRVYGRVSDVGQSRVTPAVFSLRVQGPQPLPLTAQVILPFRGLNFSAWSFLSQRAK